MASSFSTDWFFTIWIDRITLLLFIIGISTHFMVEIHHRVKLKNNDPSIKWINRWSLLVLAMCVIRLIQSFLMTFKPICLYVNPDYFPTVSMTGIAFIFYQIERLRVCLTSYFSICFFRTLYANGVTFILYLIIIMNIGNVREVVPTVHGCQRLPSKLWILLSLIAVLWGFTFGIYVLGVYVYLVGKLNQESVKTDWGKIHDISYKKVNAYLRKVLFLTSFMVLSSMVRTILSGIFLLSTAITECIHAAILYICVYLMLEHNNDQYVMFMKWSMGKNLCCCCRKFIHSTFNTELEMERHSTNMTTIATMSRTDPVNNNSDDHHLNINDGSSITGVHSSISVREARNDYSDGVIITSTESDTDPISMETQNQLFMAYKISQVQCLKQCMELGLSEDYIDILVSKFQDNPQIDDKL